MTLRRNVLAAAITAACAAAFGAAVLMLGSSYIVSVATTLAMWIALSQSWVMLSGMTGYISLGHAVFFGLGGYVMAITWKVVPIWLSLAASGVAAALLAFLVGYPCLRVRGPYFVILTFGLAEFVKYIVINIEAALSKFGRLLIGVPEIETIFVMMLVLAAVAFYTTYALRRSRFGAGLRAIREDEEAAETSGVPVAWFKVAAFVVSAVIPGVAGAVFLLRSGYFEPLQAFNPSVSLSMITMAVIGGSDDAYGPLAGALFLVILSELLWANLPELYMVLLGVLLVVFVLGIPDGIEGRLRSWLGRAG
jgi:branched-chain amino acid transport system permease protein